MALSTTKTRRVIPRRVITIRQTRASTGPNSLDISPRPRRLLAIFREFPVSLWRSEGSWQHRSQLKRGSTCCDCGWRSAPGVREGRAEAECAPLDSLILSSAALSSRARPFQRQRAGRASVGLTWKRRLNKISQAQRWPPPLAHGVGMTARRTCRCNRLMTGRVLPNCSAIWPPTIPSYLQPASLSHALRSTTCVFSHCVIDWVSSLLILLFMHMQYF
jgi:hypothetical protein